ncbi:MAG: hypothetical protein JWL87_442 [Candidatus Adlerbacteria bacterium]|nr:hypothetical protein [Candidatus Adlerbacteria bacterium]
MLQLMRSVRELRQSGQLHRALITRLVMFAVISLILLGFVGFQIAQGTADWRLVLPLALVGFGLGVTVFARMGKAVWDEETEMVIATKMDRWGFLVLALYIAFEVGLRTELPRLFPAVASTLPLLLAAIFGTIFGRFVGMLREILRAHKGRENY